MILVRNEERDDYKETTGRQLAERLQGSKKTARWPRHEVYRYLQSSGFDWDGAEWCPTGNHPVQVDALPSGWFI